MALAQQAEPKSSPRLTGYGHLPFDLAAQAFEDLEVAYHDRADLASAYYEPPIPILGPQIAGGGVGRPPSSQTGAVAESEATEDGLQDETEPIRAEDPVSGRLVLYRGSFPENAPIDVVSLPIDSAENLSFALLVAALHREVIEETSYGSSLRRSAGVPSGPLSWEEESSRRLGEDLLTLASFGSHLLSLANEIERSQRRRLARGDRGLCSLIERRIGLFVVWERAFEGDFLSSLPGPGGALRAVDEAGKRSLLREVLEGWWVGDAVVDFWGRYCRE
jgi:hypothetical protein